VNTRRRRKLIISYSSLPLKPTLPSNFKLPSDSWHRNVSRNRTLLGNFKWMSFIVFSGNLLITITPILLVVITFGLILYSHLAHFLNIWICNVILKKHNFKKHILLFYETNIKRKNNIIHCCHVYTFKYLLVSISTFIYSFFLLVIIMISTFYISSFEG